MAAEVHVEHAYPVAFAFVRRHGPQALAVLHDLLAHAESRGDDLVVRASVRQVAGRLGFASKDTVHRQVRTLIRAGVLERLETAHLGLTPGAVARALARLRSEGLVTHVRQPGEAGRFGLSAYVLAPVPGLHVIDAPRAPDALGPGAAAPPAVPPHLERPGVADAPVAGAGVGGEADRWDGRPRRSVDRPESVPAVDAHPVAPGRSGHGGGRSARRRDRTQQPPPAAQLSILDADPLRPSP